MALATTAEKTILCGGSPARYASRARKLFAPIAIDLERARNSGRGGAFVERLTLIRQRIEAMARSVEEVEALPIRSATAIESGSGPTG